MHTALKARRLLREQRFGILSTLSKKLNGYPFGSIVPYLLDQNARPLILISTLAEHTKNIDQDERVSLLVHEPVNDVQAHARATLVGDAARLVEADEQLKNKYLRYFPKHQNYFETHDFFFYRIEPGTLRYIGGFGEIHWVSKESYHPPLNSIAGDEDKICAHMNQHHADSLRDYCRFYHRTETLDVRMIGIDCDGFDLRADDDLLRFNFNHEVLDSEQARAALIAMAKASSA